VELHADDQLLALAESGRLRAPGVLDSQVKRMLSDPRSNSLAGHFAGQWLETNALDDVKWTRRNFRPGVLNCATR